MSDLSVLSVDELAEKVLAGMGTDDCEQGNVDALSELRDRASERDQAVRERDEAQKAAGAMSVNVTYYAERADRLAAALERITDDTYVGNYIADEVVEIYRKWAADALAADQECEHEWVDARNEAVISGEWCRKCNAIRAADQEQ